jgi:hypothetical protein
VLAETGVDSVSYRTVKRRLPLIAKPVVRQALSAACAARAGLGPASLVLYDVSTLYFETDTADGFREPGFSNERRLEPQITIGLLTDASGFPLMVEAFEGNRAEAATMLPVINAFKHAHQLTDVTVVADAGMIYEANQTAMQAAGLSFVPGSRRCPGTVLRQRNSTSHTEHSARRVACPVSSTALDPVTGQRTVRVTHPFHPWFGREFVFLAVRQTWSEDRVFFLDENGQQFSLPVGWTDAAAPDAFVTMAAAGVRSGSPIWSNCGG